MIRARQCRRTRHAVRTAVTVPISLLALAVLLRLLEGHSEVVLAHGTLHQAQLDTGMHQVVLVMTMMRPLLPQLHLMRT